MNRGRNKERNKDRQQRRTLLNPLTANADYNPIGFCWGLIRIIMDYNGNKGHPSAHLNATLPNATATATKANTAAAATQCKYNATLMIQQHAVWHRKKVKVKTCWGFMGELGQQSKHEGTNDPKA